MTLEKDDNSTRKRILQSACKEFALKGFAGARMHSIAESAKVNAAMLHYYYNDKKKLHLAVLTDLFKIKNYDLLTRDLINLKLSDPYEKLCVAIYVFIRLHFKVSPEYKHQIMAWEIAEGRENLKSLVQSIFIPHIESFEMLIQEGIEKKVFKAKYPLLVVMNIIWFVIAYRMHELTYRGSRLYERLYQGKQEEVIFEFISEHTCKALCEQNKIPKLGKALLCKIDDYIEKINF